jgi:hypothetical protein
MEVTVEEVRNLHFENSTHEEDRIDRTEPTEL